MKKIRVSKSWSILNWVYKHIRTDKLVCTDTQYGLLKIRVTTRVCRKNTLYIYSLEEVHILVPQSYIPEII
jgi:hypothetical protein